MGTKTLLPRSGGTTKLITIIILSHMIMFFVYHMILDSIVYNPCATIYHVMCRNKLQIRTLFKNGIFYVFDIHII